MFETSSHMAFAGQRGGFLAAIRWLLGGITGRPANQETARVHAGQAVNQSAVATSDVQHVRTRRDRRRESAIRQKRTNLPLAKVTDPGCHASTCRRRQRSSAVLT